MLRMRILGLEQHTFFDKGFIGLSADKKKK